MLKSYIRQKSNEKQCHSTIYDMDFICLLSGTVVKQFTDEITELFFFKSFAHASIAAIYSLSAVESHPGFYS